MNVKNNGTHGTRGFIQVQATVRIKTLRPMCVDCIMIRWVEILSTPPFIG
jgi:hypothetical protein